MAKLCDISQMFRDLQDAEGNAPPGGRGSIVKARADMLALWYTQDGLEVLRGSARAPATQGQLASAVDLVRRGVSSPRAARLLGLDIVSEQVRDALAAAEDARKATIELGLYARVMYDGGTAALAALKTWTEEVITLTTEKGRREFTLKDLIADCPELAEYLVQRYGIALPPDPSAVV